MNKSINLESAWQFLFEKMFCQKTKLLYDYRTDTEADGATRHLPTIEEIQNNIPNRCGWFSGMEDSNINGGTLLDAALYRYERTKDAKFRQYALDLYEGLMLNATLSKQPGFLIRARHPEDGITHYINSSRDQYTHWIHAMLHFYQSELASAEQRAAIRKTLIRFAEKAERDVTAQNQYCLTDEQGGIALVCTMYGDVVRSHESLRLAMFYMAAYAVSKDEHWKTIYHSSRDWGLTLGEKIHEDHLRRCFALVQMQLSLRVLYEWEEDLSYRTRYARLMEAAAEQSEQYSFVAKEQLCAKALPETVISWRNCPEEFIWKDTDPYGFGSTMPDVYKASCGEDAWLHRNVADALIVQGLCESFPNKREQINIFEEMLATFPLHSCMNTWCVSYCLAAELLQKKGGLSL